MTFYIKKACLIRPQGTKSRTRDLHSNEFFCGGLIIKYCVVSNTCCGEFFLNRHTLRTGGKHIYVTHS